MDREHAAAVVDDVGTRAAAAIARAVTDVDAVPDQLARLLVTRVEDVASSA